MQLHETGDAVHVCIMCTAWVHAGVVTLHSNCYLLLLLTETLRSSALTGTEGTAPQPTSLEKMRSTGTTLWRSSYDNDNDWCPNSLLLLASPPASAPNVTLRFRGACRVTLWVSAASGIVLHS